MKQGLEALVTLHSDKKQGVMNVDALLFFSFLPVHYPCPWDDANYIKVISPFQLA